MKRKRILALVLILTMLVSFIGCDNNGGTSTTSNSGPSDSNAEQKIDFPKKSVTLVVPYAAGGSSDMSARPLADKIGSIIGQPVVVKNTPGAGGSIGAAEVFRSKPDGYTLLNSSIGPLTIAPYTSEVGYTYEDFKAVAQATDIPLSLAVNKNSPFETLEDFINYAKEHPGELQIGNPGAGNIQHVAMAHFESVAGIKITHVPYEGANPAVAALLGEHIDGIMTGITEQIPHYKEGAFRVLAMTGEERSDMMPDVKTFREEGYDDVVFGVWYGIVAPKETPDEIIRLLDDATEEALKSDTVIDGMAKLNLIISYKNHEEFAERIASDASTNQKILEGLGMTIKK